MIDSLLQVYLAHPELQNIDALVLACTHYPLLREKIEEFRSKYHPKTICVTRGEHGAIVWHDHESYESPGCPVQVGDTVGAGDSFLATFVAGLLKNEPMQQLVDNACTVGSFVASKRGANPPYDGQIKKLLGLS